MARRSYPSYFGGFPFIRYDCPNENGDHTYGMHGPITRTLIRGYVSHGCTRMEGSDAQRIFELIHLHPSTPVTIQREPEIDAAGNVVDLETEVALFAPGEAIPYGESVDDPPPYDDTGTDERGCSDDRLEPGEIENGFVHLDGPGETEGLLLCSRDEEDRFTIDLEAGADVFVEIDGFNPVVSNLDLRAMAPDGGLLSSSRNTVEPEETLSFTAPTDGTYSIEIYRGADLVADAQTNGYTLRVDVQ